MKITSWKFSKKKKKEEEEEEKRIQQATPHSLLQSPSNDITPNSSRIKRDHT